MAEDIAKDPDKREAAMKQIQEIKDARAKIMGGGKQCLNVSRCRCTYVNCQHEIAGCTSPGTPTSLLEFTKPCT